MHISLLLFAVGLALSSAVFLVALLELLFTVQRRRITRKLEEEIKGLKANYNTSLNKLVLEDDAKLEEADKTAESVKTQVEAEKKLLADEYQKKLDSITQKSDKELDTAQAKAHKLQREAKMKADEYLHDRQKEVEQELMDLVIAVTKKVLPQGINYEGQKELVKHALQELRSEKESDTWKMLRPEKISGKPLLVSSI